MELSAGIFSYFLSWCYFDLETASFLLSFPSTTGFHSLSLFSPKETLQLLLLMRREKKSKHQATRLMRDRLTWQLTKNKTNYPSSCRYPGFRRKQSGEPSQTLSVLHPCHLSPPKGHLELGRQSATHLHFLPQALQLLRGISLGCRSMLDSPPQTHTLTE